ncbi:MULTISPECIES: 50S ribosomal protein L25/general stress protein Ctc [Roseivirga]|jgi:large subunit ribosomal protein L25|uniref:Large ribosomal subunit protein bL25 n=1 Tax=Roseivirga spongicola TaxID=333140 RepID=A0A150X3H5_9BACT|nr:MULTISPECIES: 50S ribosomal protein L25/general stress protein Ctc [Roseivirga]KYG73285.1 50S ribosomal protein L25/general stress protein Ctc [Roseivirga spongicola]MBO6497471.1 50S ribosomal protein L25/general stress protein Ctc [Roseivirga sp.]MBO6659507.1 50S ribosomal protein L25/general stress protein Ctc [Roseivirga sp.]MBO6761232.1 50S ribosomal protein L25/general stress protein Ctc [Roseivirga sp.]MBO6907756.1 50S ribosomal protein L25/general stress protein Ctc [Roseivirga sp.]
MREVEIIGFKRANLGKTESNRLRAEGNVPGVLYGGDTQVHFYAPAIQFKPVLYTPEACFIKLNIEGEIYETIIQESQWHPVSEALLHVDLLQLFRGTPIKMNIPVKTVGNAVGVKNGGTLIIKNPKLAIKALPKDMPEVIEIDVTNLRIGKAIKVGELPTENFEFLTSPIVTVVNVAIPRALRGKSAEELEAAEAEDDSAE